MKKNNFNYCFIGIISLILLGSCISNKSKKTQITSSSSQHNFINQSNIPIFPGCEYDNMIAACLQNSVSELILKEANRQNLTLRNDTLKIGFRVNVDGTTTILDNETNNNDLKKISESVLTTLPIIEPAFSKKLNEYVTSAYIYYILIKNNSITNKFEK